MLSLEVRALGSPKGLTVKGTHIQCQGGCQVDMSLPTPPRAGVGREDKVGLTRVTLPSKCLLCNGEPHSLIRTKEKARSSPPHPGSVVIDGEGGCLNLGGKSSEATTDSANPLEGRGL